MSRRHSRPLILVVAMMFSSVVAGTDTDGIVLFQLRNRVKIYGRILSYSKGEYEVAGLRRRRMRIPLKIIRSIVYSPRNRPDGNISAGNSPADLTDEDILRMALDIVEQERRENRQKKLELKNASALGLGSLLDGVSDKMQDNALKLLKEDKELQAIIMDPQIQKLIEKGDYMALMANPKILNIVSNPQKRQKFMKAFFGATGEDKKKGATP